MFDAEALSYVERVCGAAAVHLEDPFWDRLGALPRALSHVSPAQLYTATRPLCERLGARCRRCGSCVVWGCARVCAASRSLCVRQRRRAVDNNLATRNLGCLLARARLLLRGPSAGAVGTANVLVLVRVLVQAVYDAVPVEALYEHFAEGGRPGCSRMHLSRLPRVPTTRALPRCARRRGSREPRDAAGGIVRGPCVGDSGNHTVRAAAAVAMGRITARALPRGAHAHTYELLLEATSALVVCLGVQVRSATVDGDGGWGHAACLRHLMAVGAEEAAPRAPGAAPPAPAGAGAASVTSPEAPAPVVVSAAPAAAAGDGGAGGDGGVSAGRPAPPPLPPPPPPLAAAAAWAPAERRALAPRLVTALVRAAVARAPAPPGLAKVRRA